jgi:hypothetical protein
MTGPQIDSVARFFGRRITRRRALEGGVFAGLVAANGAAITRSPAALAIQDGTPTPTAASSDAAFLFVQTFESGRWTSNPSGDGSFSLSLTGHAAETIYFSDRPERIVGTVPTHQFLGALGFTPADPPNAALVARTATGDDVVVLELFDPIYQEEFDSDGGVTVTYAARVLADYAGDGLAHLASQQSDGNLAESFGPASLFIDDCPDEDPLNCYTDCFTEPVGNLGRRGMCWQWFPPDCLPCSGGWDGTAAECNAAFPACNGNCFTDTSACQGLP